MYDRELKVFIRLLTSTTDLQYFSVVSGIEKNDSDGSSPYSIYVSVSGQFFNIKTTGISDQNFLQDLFDGSKLFVTESFEKLLISVHAFFSLRPVVVQLVRHVQFL